MTDYYGGSRARLITTSLYNFINNGINDLGWYDSDRKHLPVTFTPKSFDALNGKLTEDLKPNLISFSDEDDTDSIEIELGNVAAEVSWDFYIDIFAESSSVGVHLSCDIRDILMGRHDPNKVTEQGPRVPIYDYNMATPVPLFHCDIENVGRGRVKGSAANAPWKKFWYVVHFEIVDSY